MLSRSVRRRIQISFAIAVSWRPTGANLVSLLRSLVTSFIALGVTLYILPGRQSSGPLAVAVLVLVVLAVGLVLRPLLLGLTAVFGSAGLLVVGLLAQAVILAVALSIAPDVHVASFSQIFGASWIATVVAALVNWLLDSGSQDAYLAQVLGRVVRITHRRSIEGDAVDGRPGLLIVQLDGVGRDLIRQAMVAGAVPTLSRWVRTGTHRGYRWHTGLPATTPAGQAVLLHGDRRRVPSFRWYEKSGGALMVANRPADAARIEQRLSTGRGLLADGGVSVSNLFSGDAPTSILTMSDARLPPRSTRGLASFAATSLGFVRTIVVFAGQVITELYQGRRQRRRDVRPRVHRGTQFAFLRAVTTALLHDLNVAIVADQMARGAPVIFVDFVDYDEIAHHAGPTRPEAMRTLDSLDQVLHFFEQVAAEASRHYEIVVVSDHGQSQGTPFAELTGSTLEQFVDSLVAPGAVGLAPSARELSEHAERWGPANVLLSGAARSDSGGIGRYARRRAERIVDPDGLEKLAVSLGRHRHDHNDEATPADAPVVTAAGSIAHIYLPEHEGRATRDEIERTRPGFIAALAASVGVGLVLVRSGARGAPIVVGASGWRSLDLAEPSGAGIDPLEPYGPRAAVDLRELDRRDHVGDLVLLGSHDPDSGETVAFEDLVGSHGGLGGDQTEAVLFVPATWPALPPGGRHADRAARPTLTGDQVHAALIERLRVLGLRPGDARPVAAPTGSPIKGLAPPVKRVAPTVGPARVESNPTVAP